MMIDLSRAGKTILIIVIVVGLINIVHRAANKEREGTATGQTPEIAADIGQNPVQATFEDLLDAIEYVESGGDPEAIGDGGAAVGCMQIHPIMVRDVNRILCWDGYTLDDRYDRYKSRQMCRIYLYHYCKDMSLEDMTRCWNGGPTGYKKESTKKYWLKIRELLEQALKEAEKAK